MQSHRFDEEDWEYADWWYSQKVDRKAEIQDVYASRALADWEILALRDKADELDIDKGGYCDCQFGAINFWSGPDNCPEGQKGLIYLKGAIGYPRNYVGSVYLADLTLDTINYERMRQEKGHDIYGAARKPYVNQPEDISWVRAQWAALWKSALLEGFVPKLTIREGI